MKDWNAGRQLFETIQRSEQGIRQLPRAACRVSAGREEVSRSTRNREEDRGRERGAWVGNERKAERERDQERKRLRDRRRQSKMTSRDADRTPYQADDVDVIDAVDARDVARQTMVEKAASRGRSPPLANA